MSVLVELRIHKIYFKSEKMKKFYLGSLLVLLLSACSQEAQPYKEQNESIPNSVEQGYIQTH